MILKGDLLRKNTKDCRGQRTGEWEKKFFIKEGGPLKVGTHRDTLILGSKDWGVYSSR